MMRIVRTKYSEHGPVQIQDHGTAFLVSYPALEPENAGYQREKIFDKTSAGAWNKAQHFAANKLREGAES